MTLALLCLLNSGPTKCTPVKSKTALDPADKSSFLRIFSRCFLKCKWHTLTFPPAWSNYSSKQFQSASWSQQGSSCWFLFVRTSSYCSLVRRPSVTLLLSSNLGNITAMYPSVEGFSNNRSGLFKMASFTSRRRPLIQLEKYELIWHHFKITAIQCDVY